MKKKLIASLFSLALSAVFALGCFAADADKVVYDGTNLTYSGSTQMSGFTQMIPGKTYTGTITLENTGDKAAYFYMDTSVVSTLIGASNAKDTGYTVSLTCGGNTLYGYDPATGKATGTLVGGDTTTGLEELNKQLEEYPLVATLDPGQTADVVLSITPDATATNVSYMGAEGKIEFRFQAADVPDVKTVVTTEKVQGAPDEATRARTIAVSARAGGGDSIAACGRAGALAANSPSRDQGSSSSVSRRTEETWRKISRSYCWFSRAKTRFCRSAGVRGLGISSSSNFPSSSTTRSGFSFMSPPIEVELHTAPNRYSPSRHSPSAVIFTW